MIGILKGYEISTWSFPDGKSGSTLYLHFELAKFENSSNRVRSEGVPVIAIKYVGNSDDVINDLLIGSSYQIKYYRDSNKRLCCNHIALIG